MKSLKFIIQEMGIDINDVRILTKAWFRYLMKTCYQRAKEHPIVSGVLTFYYLLYIFYPSIFNILFYTFPLVICLAILLGEPRFILEKPQNNTKKDHNVSNTTRSICDFTSINDSKNRCTYLQTHMSRRTIGRFDDNENSNNNNYNLPNVIEEKTQIISTRVTPSSRSDSNESQSDEEDSARGQEKNKHVVEWTEYDEKNLMNLGSSEIERNKRLESLIAKRRARKMFSMQPRRHNFYSFDQHDQLDQQVMGSIFVSKGGIEFDDNGDDYQQPGSAPSVLLPTRNPFDLPYGPHEEKPVLTGGSFDEEFFFDEQHRDLLKDHFKFCNNSKYEISKMDEYNKDDIIFPRFFTKSNVVSNNNIIGSTRFGRESDAEERLKEIIEELSMRQENGPAKDQRDEESPHEVQPKSNDNHDEGHHTFENPFAIYNEIVGSNNFVSLPKRGKETKLAVTNNEEHNIFNTESKSISSCTRDDLAQSTQDHVVLSDYKGQIDDDEESSTSSSASSSSSSSVNERTRLDATKNEAFRNSVRKVLTCLAAFPRNNNNLLQQSNLHDLLACNTNSPSNIIPSKMQERSFYTEPHHHKSNFSIASDMQVEVSEGGSPPMTANEANSPTGQGSYDGDDDKDVNSIDDEELWGISPHLTKRGEFGMNFKLKDTLEEEEKVNNRPSNLCNVDNNVLNNVENDPCPTISMSREEEEGGSSDQEATVGGVVSSLSPRSILPNVGKKKLVVDLQSTNGDILESSSSSSSEGLTSQMISKVDHLAEYLANLPPSECGSNFLEDVERSSHVRERKPGETFHDEINQIFEFEDSKEGSQRSIEDSTSTTSQIKEQKETSATSNEFHANDLNKEHVDQASSTTEQNDYFRRIEDEDEPIAANENELNSMTKLKDSISDSNSTTCQEDFLDQLRLEDNMKVTPLHQVQDEHKDKSLSNNQIIRDADESTSQERAKEDHNDINL